MKKILFVMPLMAISLFSCGGSKPKSITFKEAVEWVNNHYKRGERTVVTDDYVWDFTATTDKDSQDFVIELLKNIDSSISSLKGSINVEDGEPIDPIMPDDFESFYKDKLDKVSFSVQNDNLIVAEEIDEEEIREIVFKNINSKCTYDNKCLLHSIEGYFDKSTADGKYIISGYLKLIYNY